MSASGEGRPRRRVMLLYGTRPEAIKVAPLIAALRAHPALEPVVAVTGQHREMLDQVHATFGITPRHDLHLMSPGASLAQIAATMLVATSELLRTDRPDLVVVQGDTSSAFAAALASFYERIPLVHLEAGLRTGDNYSPFPEEANRRLTAPLAALHLAPTVTSRRNLESEGIDPATIAVTGNTVIDALHATLGTPAAFADPAVARVVAGPRRILLVTTHRRESWGDRMAAAMDAVRVIAKQRPDIQVVLPMHLNPVVRRLIEPRLAGLDNVLLTEPLRYDEFAHVLNASHVVLTDSGGVQEEAPSLGKPVLVMRDTTERPEGVHSGTVRLVGTDLHVITEQTLRLFADDEAYAAMAAAVNPYGDGVAAARCVGAIAELLGVGDRMPDFVAHEADAGRRPGRPTYPPWAMHERQPASAVPGITRFG
jgi:UDP-N-acetylglucosamine 2-epimerase (non-hydrolysing)